MDRLIYAVEERSSGNLWKKFSQIDGVGAFYEYEKGDQAACASTEKRSRNVIFLSCSEYN